MEITRNFTEEETQTAHKIYEKMLINNQGNEN